MNDSWVLIIFYCILVASLLGNGTVPGVPGVRRQVAVVIIPVLFGNDDGHGIQNFKMESKLCCVTTLLLLFS